MPETRIPCPFCGGTFEPFLMYDRFKPESKLYSCRTCGAQSPDPRKGYRCDSRAPLAPPDRDALASIRAQLAAATPGPWKLEWEGTEGDNFHASIYEDDYKGLLIARCNQNGAHSGDEEFIANAPEIIAFLLGLVGRLSAPPVAAESEVPRAT